MEESDNNLSEFFGRTTKHQIFWSKIKMVYPLGLGEMFRKCVKDTEISVYKWKFSPLLELINQSFGL